MDTAINSTSLNHNFHWFDKFLAGLCIFFGLFMIAGMGSSTAAAVRSTDASIGLLKRDTSFYFKNLDKIAQLTSPVSVNAQFAVAIVANFDQLIKEAAILTFKFILQKIVSLLISSLRGILDGLLTNIKTWIKTLSGLLDSVKSFLSAIAIKVFATQECTARTSAQVVSGIFGVSVSQIDSDLENECSKGSKRDSGDRVSVDKNPLSDYTIADNFTRSDFDTVKNSVSNLRLSSLVKNATIEVYPSNQLDETTLSDKGQSTQTVSKVPTTKEIESKVEEISNSIAYYKCANIGQSKGYTYQSTTTYNPKCVLDTVTVSTAVRQILAEDTAAFQNAKTNVTNAAPADCKLNGYIGSTPKSTDSSGNLNYKPLFSDYVPTASFSAGAVSYSSTYSINTLTAEQCNNSNQFNTLQTSVSTQVAASKGDKSADTPLDIALQAVLDATLNDLITSVNNILNDFVAKVFTLVIKVVTKFLGSLPGGEFLSSSLTSSLTNASNDIKNKITDGLNALRK
jgi:hypothetical protein